MREGAKEITMVWKILLWCLAIKLSISVLCNFMCLLDEMSEIRKGE
jgi:hypothetical protein